jgi:copper chaperone CopZ
MNMRMRYRASSRLTAIPTGWALRPGAPASRLSFQFALLFLCGVPCAAAEPSPVKHRVTGLFAPDRQADLRELVQDKLPGVRLVAIDYETSEAIFNYDADKLFNKPKPEQIPERFDNLLRSVSHSTFGIRPLCAIPKDKLERIEIPVAGLDCKACCLAAYESIYRIDGVERATASFRDGLVTALIDPAKTTRLALEEALKKRNVTLKTP